jgi:hypothetical protein
MKLYQRQFMAENEETLFVEEIVTVLRQRQYCKQGLSLSH